jgi:hypothetical protein
MTYAEIRKHENNLELPSTSKEWAEATDGLMDGLTEGWVAIQAHIMTEDTYERLALALDLDLRLEDIL